MVALSLVAAVQHHSEDDMRYRREDDDGDYTFGQGDDTWLVNSPEAVAQAIKTRFLLWYGEWFLDTTAGTPWIQSVLGRHKSETYNLAVS